MPAPDITYSREHPSPRYLDLIELYRRMHVEGERFSGQSASQTFSGKSLAPQAGRIKVLIDGGSAANVLDYGCGKAMQYLVSPVLVKDVGSFETLQDYWGVDFVHRYDPGYEPYGALPVGKFDGVICTDVLEHCPEEDLPWIVGELFGYALRFVFASVAAYPASKRLPNGENAHVTIRDACWWHALFSGIAARHPGVLWEVWLEHRDPLPGGKALSREVLIGSAHPAP